MRTLLEILRRVLARKPAEPAALLGVSSPAAVTGARPGDEASATPALYDPLTGLPDGSVFRDRLQLALDLAARHARRIGLLTLDLDGFRRINETLGRSLGDRVLRELARRFTESVRLSDYVARAASGPAGCSVSRLEGDQFTVLLNEIDAPHGAAAVAQRMLETLREPIRVADREVEASASVGIALFPEDGTNVETLLRHANVALNQARSCGPNHFQFYTRGVDRSGKRRLAIERRLRHAREHDELALHYQPVRDVRNGRVTGAEALLRWSDAEIGTISPAEFVPIAEQIGLIGAIGEWVLRSACRQLRSWVAEGFRPIRVAVNLSGGQIRQPDFVRLVEHALAESGVSPHWLELEITESTIIQDDERTQATLEGLRDLGVGLALDDFGTGYSSLVHLKRYPIDRLKIDRSFVEQLPESRDDAAITSAILAMAASLGLSVVAEGVETERQLEFLRSHGCQEVQGFLFSPAVPPAEFERFLELEKLEDIPA